MGVNNLGGGEYPGGGGKGVAAGGGEERLCRPYHLQKTHSCNGNSVILVLETHESF